MWPFLGWLLFVASGADFVSTELALRIPGAVELNPLGQKRWARVAATVVAPTVVRWSTEKLYRKHPRWAWAIRIGSVTLWSFATVHNLRIARGPP